MAQSGTQQPTKTLRGTWDQILARSNEIPKTSEIELRVFETTPEPKGQNSVAAMSKFRSAEDPAFLADPEAAASIALLNSWIADAPTDLDEIQAAEEELREFKRNMNQARKDVGARLLYPEVE